ncbi:MAG: serine hydrolase, partial [Lachnospiraceae bacterium]|nr:serine hydrolase [Lachnospiraceae bacterium]
MGLFQLLHKLLLIGKFYLLGQILIKILSHLLSHSSGVPDARPRGDRNFMLTATDEQSVQYMKDLKELHFEPGTDYEYINPTFDLFYLLVE